MNWLDQIRSVRIVLVLIAVLIAIGSLLSSNFLIQDLKTEEMKKMEIWAEAMRTFNNADENTDLNLVIKVINGNSSIPIIVLQSDGELISSRNINKHLTEADSVNYLKSRAEEMRRKGNVIKIDVPDFDAHTRSDYLLICYDESLMLKRLQIYPYIQLCVVVVFVFIALFAVFSTMRSEQNKLWVGLSKETAHQLGTPISSLTAWNEVLRETYPDDELLPEMAKDINRLERIAERFSKIGSVPEPRLENIVPLLNNVVHYLQKRTSNKVVISTHFPNKTINVMLIPSLFEWVAENLCKNAVDAMNGVGSIDIYIGEESNMVYVEVKDTGKGIPSSKYESVFKPGYTTKARGWGLGLSLAKRIIDDYHKGHIYVKESRIGVGTTFRIEIPR